MSKDGLWPNAVGGKSSTFIFRMLDVDTREVHATYEVTEVFFATKTRKSTSMPTSSRQALESRMDVHSGD